MTDYVLEILDGDQAGDVVDLGDRLAIGRRPDNDLVLKDEKCSGHHAEIVREDGGFVLRDLESRNGTMMDGRRIQEVALQPGDEFQLGRVHARFRAAGEPVAAAAGAAASDGGGGGGEAAGEELLVNRLDDAKLARGAKRRSPVLMIGLLVLLLGAGAYVLFGDQLGGGGGGGAGGGGARNDKPLVLDGNLLAAGVADFEGLAEGAGDSGWALQGDTESGAFLPMLGAGAAHSGVGAVEARGGAADVYDDESEDGEGAMADTPPVTWAYAYSTSPIRVSAGTRLRVRGFVSTEGAGRGLVRLAMFNSEDFAAARAAAEPDDDESDAVVAVDDARLLRSVLQDAVRSGAAFAGGDGWEEQQAEVVVPAGYDRAVVELLARVPDGEASVAFDDIGIVRLEAGEPARARTDNGRMLEVAGAELLSDGPAGPFLAGAVPIVSDGIDRALAERGLLTLSDVGYGTRIARREAGDGFVLSFPGGAGEGVALLLPSVSGVRVAAADGQFRTVESEFDAPAARSVLFGDGELRCALEFPGDVSVRGRTGGDLYRLELRGTLDIELLTTFVTQAVQARQQLETAQQHVRDGQPGMALAELEGLLGSVPHDPELAQAAGTLRAELLEEERQAIAELLIEGRSAAFFEARVGYQRVLGGIEALRTRYEGVELARSDELETIAEAMRAGLAVLDAARGERHGQLLGQLAEAFELAGSDDLASRIRGYVTTHYPADSGTGAADTGSANGGGNDEEGNDEEGKD